MNNYRLILINNIANRVIGGGATNVDFTCLSSYGKIFYEFIDGADFDKKIVRIGWISLVAFDVTFFLFLRILYKDCKFLLFIAY